MESTSGTLNEGLNREHLIAAVLAAIFSVAAHMALISMISDIRFDLAVLARDIRPVRLERAMDFIQATPAPALDTPLAGLQAPGDPILQADLTKQVKEMAVMPDEVVIQPPALAEEKLSVDAAAAAAPSAMPQREVWEPRQEILAIQKQVVADEVINRDRRKITRIDRVSSAQDVVLPVEWSKVAASAAAVEGSADAKPAPARIETAALPGAVGTKPGLLIGAGNAGGGADLFTEDLTSITAFKPIDQLLTARVVTYTSMLDMKYGYFRIEIDRVSPEALPPIPKDIVFVQDSSASMTEQKLYFCREGLVRALAQVGEEDRFNVISFKDSAEMCFPGWSKRTPEAIEKARVFIGNMKAGGNTDIFNSVKQLLNLERTAGRPVIALVVTDGHSTAGLTRSSDIIGEFSKLNDGAVSAFAMGTVQTANTYLLDLFSYCNRGTSLVVTKGRWDIPDAMHGLANEISRVVLADVKFHFALGGDCLVYPVLTSNLYLDRPLVLYGRYPKGMESVVFQVFGNADKTRCDMIFNLSLDKAARTRDRDIRTVWAQQRIYHLIGEYARNPDPQTMEEIRRTAKTYGVQVPYSGSF